MDLAEYKATTLPSLQRVKLDEGHLAHEDDVLKDNPKDVGNAFESAEVELGMWFRLRDRRYERD